MYQGKEVVFILPTDTSEMLDYVIKCFVCHECSAHSKWDKKSEKYKTGGTSTRPSLTLIIADRQIAWKHKVHFKMFLCYIDKNGL